MAEGNGLFREKSIGRVSSPEQLDDYMRVANPGVWTLLAAVIALLIGVCVWGVFGRLDTFADTAVVSDGERSFCVVRSEYMDDVGEGAVVEAEGERFTVAYMENGGGINARAASLAGVGEGEPFALAVLDGALPAGIYEAKLVVESVAPMSFVLN